MRNLIYTLFVVIVLQLTVSAQPVITAPILTGSLPGTFIEVPITVTNFNDVVSLSLVLHFDMSVLHYIEFTSASSQLATGNLFMYGVDSTLYVSWYAFEPVTIPEGQIFNLIFSYSGGISPIVWDTNGIMGAMTFQDGEVTSSTTTGIAHQIPGKNKVEIYPNPATDIINIDLEKPINGTLEMIDFSGKLIRSLQINEQSNKYIFPFSEVKSGIYFARIVSSDGGLVECRKFIVNL